MRVADCYADQETRRAASTWIQIPFDAATSHWRRGIAQLIKKEDTKPVGLLYGSGFESRPQLIEEFSQQGKLLGNPPSCIRFFNDPNRFFLLLQNLAIPAPATQRLPPANSRGWLRKAIAGTGGCHVLPAQGVARSACYYQRKLAGQPASVLFLANGKEAQILGYNRLWTAPTPAASYRYGGIATPLHLAPSTRAHLQNHLHALVAATGLRGLNGLDFIQDKKAIQVLEVNPRPPASLDLYQGCSPNLFEAHIQACLGGPLPSAPLAAPTARAFTILYAPHRLWIPPDFVWPSFCRDRPIARSRIEKGAPICSIHGTGSSIEACQRLIGWRQQQILKWLI